MPYGLWHNAKRTPALLEAYVEAFPDRSARYPTWVFPRHIRKSQRRLDEIESHLSRLSHVPAQILRAAPRGAGTPSRRMHRWQGRLPLHETEMLDDASHFVQKDRPDRLVAAIRGVLQRGSNSGGVKWQSLFGARPAPATKRSAALGKTLRNHPVRASDRGCRFI